MPSISLSPANHALVREALARHAAVVACLCADWCDVCRQYRDGFEQLSIQHPKVLFLWIDIEDNADAVGDLDVENFPTLLMQHGETVAFFGPVLPDRRVAERLLTAQTETAPAMLAQEAQSSEERRRWQQECNLHLRLTSA